MLSRYSRLVARLCHPDPLGKGFPVRIILGFKLPAAGVKGIPACLGREGMQQKNAAFRVTRSHQVRDTSEVLPRLLLRPRCAPGRHSLKVKERFILRMASVASRVFASFLYKDRLDFGFKIVVVERRLFRGGSFFC